MDTRHVSELIRDVAGRLILPRFRHLQPGEIQAKHPGDLVTVADRETEAELTRVLQADDRLALVVGEEASFANPDLVTGVQEAEHAWVIDPLDGTNNFARGDAGFGVIVAELRQGETVRAWIWHPVRGRMFVAERGSGVECNEAMLAPIPTPRQPYRALVPRSLRREPAEAFDLHRTAGSCAIDYPRLLVGEVALLGFRHCRPWDHLAGVLMVNELGGHAAVHPGTPYRAGVQGPVLLVAASRELWHQADRTLVAGRVAE